MRWANPEKPPLFQLLKNLGEGNLKKEIKRRWVFRGLRFLCGVYIDAQSISFFNSHKVRFLLSVFVLFLCIFFFLLFSLSFYINIEKNRCSERWLSVGGCVGVGMLSCIAYGLSWFSDVVKCE